MNGKICCFVGHRQFLKDHVPQIEKLLEAELLNLIAQGVINFLIGGSFGFDMLAAEVVMNLKNNFDNIKLIVILPCKNRIEYLRPLERQKYNNILKKADEIIYLSKNYYVGCMLERNKHMIDNSEFCISYFKKNCGGILLHTLNYAGKKGTKVINLAEK